MSSERPQENREENSQAIQKIRTYHNQGRQRLKEIAERGTHGSGAIDAQADAIGWNQTKLRKARQFAHPQDGRLDELCRLSREHRPRFRTAHVGLLVTVAWPDRERLQKKCVEGDWGASELEAEIKRRYGPRKHGGPAEPDRVLLQLDGMA